MSQQSLFQNDVDGLTLSPEASHVRTSVSPGTGKGLAERDPASIGKYIALQTKYSQLGYFLRMSLLSELEAQTKYSYHWLKSDTLHGLSWWVLGQSAHRIKDKECGLWPTVTKSDGKRIAEFSITSLARRPRETGQANGWNLAEEIAAEFDAYLTPAFCEWMMGLPPNWTQIE